MQRVTLPQNNSKVSRIPPKYNFKFLTYSAIDSKLVKFVDLPKWWYFQSRDHEERNTNSI